MKCFYSCRAVCISDDTFLTVHSLDVCCSISHQNMWEEKQLIQACKEGDLETVKKLSIQVTLQNVRDLNWPYFRLLHHAARLVMKY